jgi:hypothetical protein
MRIAGEIVNSGTRVSQLGHMATSTQNWGTPIVLYLRRAHLFLHFKQLDSAGLTRVEVGDVLEFDVMQAEKGLVASNVSLVR